MTHSVSMKNRHQGPIHKSSVRKGVKKCKFFLELLLLNRWPNSTKMLLPAISKLLVHQNAQARRRKGKMHQNNGLQMFWNKEKSKRTNEAYKMEQKSIKTVFCRVDKRRRHQLCRKVQGLVLWADSQIFTLPYTYYRCSIANVHRIVLCSNASVLKLLNSEVPRNPLKASQSLKVCSVQVYIGKVQSFVLLWKYE